jgi:hypothetical protein
MKKTVYVFEEIPTMGNIVGLHLSEIKNPRYPGHDLTLLGTTEIEITPLKKTVTKEALATLFYEGSGYNRIATLLPQKVTNVRILYDIEE